jgi:hypothetical protein
MVQSLPSDDPALSVTQGHLAELVMDVHATTRYLSFHGCLLPVFLERLTHRR